RPVIVVTTAAEWPSIHVVSTGDSSEINSSSVWRFRFIDQPPDTRLPRFVTRRRECRSGNDARVRELRLLTCSGQEFFSVRTNRESHSMNKTKQSCFWRSVQTCDRRHRPQFFDMKMG